jgi:pyruvate,water dikinase
MGDLDHNDIKALNDAGRAARALMLDTPLPPAVNEAILDGYRRLCQRLERTPEVAVRSSATAEDLPEASFAGQQDTILNVRGEDSLIEACHRCFASLWTDRAISYRAARGFDHFDVALSIGVQPMVRSDQAFAMLWSSTAHGVWAKPSFKAWPRRMNGWCSNRRCKQARVRS